jgi:hypothetical protein
MTASSLPRTDFLAGAGDMGARIRDFNWTAGRTPQ